MIRRWFTTPILMIINVTFQKISEQEKYHTYWRLHIPMLLNMMKKGLAPQNSNTNNTSVVGKISQIFELYHIL